MRLINWSELSIPVSEVHCACPMLLVKNQCTAARIQAKQNGVIKLQ
jgi:hypothetical protein